VSGVDWPLLQALLVWLFTVALAGWLPSTVARWAVVLPGALAVLWLVPPVMLAPARAFGGAWLLAGLALLHGRLDSRRVAGALLRGLVAGASVALLARLSVLLAGLPGGWPVPAVVVGLGLALVGWQLCRLTAGTAWVWDYPVWLASLGWAVLGRLAAL